MVDFRASRLRSIVSIDEALRSVSNQTNRNNNHYGNTHWNHCLLHHRWHVDRQTRKPKAASGKNDRLGRTAGRWDASENPLRRVWRTRLGHQDPNGSNGRRLQRNGASRLSGTLRLLFRKRLSLIKVIEFSWSAPRITIRLPRGGLMIRLFTLERRGFYQTRVGDRWRSLAANSQRKNSRVVVQVTLAFGLMLW